jgi:uncharacterized radical SAM superfamily protein
MSEPTAPITTRAAAPARGTICRMAECRHCGRNIYAHTIDGQWRHLKTGNVDCARTYF